METSTEPLRVQIIQDLADKVRHEIGKVIVGQEETIDLMLVALLTRGHVLIEGVPGIAKTLTARMMAKTLSAGFARIQFTPDLMPSDILGTMVFRMKTEEFTFNPGPVFSNLVLIDEINRAPAKTQAALFEVMEERQVTMDGKTWPMQEPFMVLATQNPIEQEGTYKLPEAQLDRFLFRIKISYPSLEEEMAILLRFREDFFQKVIEEVQPVVSPQEITQCAAIIEKVMIRDELLDYIARIVHETRNNRDLFLGASPRASLAVMKSSKAMAAIQGRDFVTPDDIRFVMGHVLNHRIILSPEKEMEGATTEEAIHQIISRIEVPR
ncbi:MAG TPA: MoxR family ATPase [Bacteroidales bacterium]|nr:MoxR family ATPase [Bacteroidales bacterium]HRZ48760.1 MoxR family ATPase [Bacteroidales bacterium]